MRQGMPGSSGAVRRFASDASEFVQQRVLFQQRPHQPEFVSLNEQCLHRHHSTAESKKHHHECNRANGNKGFAKRFTPTSSSMVDDVISQAQQPSSVPPSVMVDQACQTPKLSGASSSVGGGDWHSLPKTRVAKPPRTSKIVILDETKQSKSLPSK